MPAMWPWWPLWRPRRVLSWRPFLWRFPFLYRRILRIPLLLSLRVLPLPLFLSVLRPLSLLPECRHPASGVRRTGGRPLLVLLPEPARVLPLRHKLSERVDEGGSNSSPSRERRGGKMKRKPGLLALFTVVALSGCATLPTGPTVTVIPSPGKPFEVFMADEGVCREWAQQQIGGASPSQTANENLAAGAVVGTMVGAGLGALIGAATGNAGAGAAIGAGAGLLGGTSIGGNAAMASEVQLQRRYDLAYQQCMYAKGNQIPGAVRRPTRGYGTPPPPPPNYGGGSWVTVPGQYVNGNWVPEHRVQLPSTSKEQGPIPRPPATQPGPYSPTPP